MSQNEYNKVYKNIMSKQTDRRTGNHSNDDNSIRSFNDGIMNGSVNLRFILKRGGLSDTPETNASKVRYHDVYILYR